MERRERGVDWPSRSCQSNPCSCFAGRKLLGLLSDEDEEEAEAGPPGKGGRAKLEEKGKTGKGGVARQITFSGKRNDATLQNTEDDSSDGEMEDSDESGSEDLGEGEDDDDDEEELMEVEKEALELDQDRWALVLRPGSVVRVLQLLLFGLHLCRSVPQVMHGGNCGPSHVKLRKQQRFDQCVCVPHACMHGCVCMVVRMGACLHVSVFGRRLMCAWSHLTKAAGRRVVVHAAVRGQYSLALRLGSSLCGRIRQNQNGRQQLVHLAPIIAF